MLLLFLVVMLVILYFSRGSSGAGRYLWTRCFRNVTALGPVMPVSFGWLRGAFYGSFALLITVVAWIVNGPGDSGDMLRGLKTGLWFSVFSFPVGPRLGGSALVGFS